MPEWFPQNHADINKLLHNVKIHNSINQTKTKMFCRVIFHNVLIYLFIFSLFIELGSQVGAMQLRMALNF